MSDDRHVYGARCAWHGSITDVSKATSIPTCPHCGSVLYETSEEKWWEGVKSYDEAHPGYEELVRWSQHPRHFANTKDAIAAFNAETGKDFSL